MTVPIYHSLLKTITYCCYYLRFLPLLSDKLSTITSNIQGVPFDWPSPGIVTVQISLLLVQFATVNVTNVANIRSYKPSVLLLLLLLLWNSCMQQFQNCCTILDLCLKSEILDGFWSSRCLNDHINPIRQDHFKVVPPPLWW